MATDEGDGVKGDEKDLKAENGGAEGTEVVEGSVVRDGTDACIFKG